MQHPEVDEYGVVTCAHQESVAVPTRTHTFLCFLSASVLLDLLGLGFLLLLSHRSHFRVPLDTMPPAWKLGVEVGPSADGENSHTNRRPLVLANGRLSTGNE